MGAASSMHPRIKGVTMLKSIYSGNMFQTSLKRFKSRTKTPSPSDSFFQKKKQLQIISFNSWQEISPTLPEKLKSKEKRMF